MTPLVATPAGRRLVALDALVCAALLLGFTAPGPARLLLDAVLVGAALGSVAVMASAAATRHWRRGTLAVVLACLGALALLRGLSGAVLEAPRLPPSAVILDGTVRDIPVAHRGEVVMVVSVDRSSAPMAGIAAVALALPGRSSLLPGDHVEVQAAALRRPSARPGPLSASLLDRAGVDAVAVSPRVSMLAAGGGSAGRVLGQMRAAVAGALDRALPEPEATLDGAVALGLRGPLPGAIDTPLRDAGLIHLVATSGLKVAVVAGVMGRLLLGIGLSPARRTAGTMAAVGVYVLVAGGGVAAVRSAVMGSLALLTARSDRRVDPVVVLMTLAATFLAADPGLTRDPGFQLSFLGTLGILVLAEPVAQLCPGPRLLVEPFAVTVAAQVATVPVQGATFGTVSLVGPVANALAVPAVAPVIILTALGLALGVVAPWMGSPPLLLAGWLLDGIVAAARALSSVPGAALHPASWPWAWTAAWLVATAGLVLGVRDIGQAEEATSWAPRHRAGRRRDPFAAPRPRTTVVAVAVAAVTVAAAGGAWLIAAGRPDGRLHVHVLSAGNGPAVLVRIRAGGLALVDGGADPAALLAALGAALPAATHTIDLLVLTGGEKAATGGLADLASHLRVARAIVPAAELGTATRALLLALRETGTALDTIPPGTPWSWSGAAMRCLPVPPVPRLVASPACALQVVDGGASVLLVGDLDVTGEDDLAAGYGAQLRSGLLVAPPGGEVTTALLAAAAPSEVAVPGDHPARVHLDAISRQGAAVRSVAASGTLDYVASSDGGLEPA